MKTILAIDPGRDKCGVAIVDESGVIHMSVEPRGSFAETASGLCAEHGVDLIIIGNGTGGSALVKELAPMISIPVELVDERFTSQRARVRFFEENPPRGLLRLVPRGLLSPPKPYDDYVALILAEEFVRRNA